MRIRILCPPGVAAYLDATEPVVPWLHRVRLRGIFVAFKSFAGRMSMAPLPWPCPAMARGLEGSRERYAARWFREKVADPGRCLILLSVEALSTLSAGVPLPGVEHRICGGSR